MKKNGDAFLIAARVAVVLVLLSTLAVGGACSALRHGAGYAPHLQSAELSGIYAARQDATSGQRPACCSGCERAAALPAALLLCSRQDPAAEPVTADPNVAIAASEVFLSSFSNSKPQPSCNFFPSRSLPFIVNCVLLC